MKTFKTLKKAIILYFFCVVMVCQGNAQQSLTFITSNRTILEPSNRTSSGYDIKESKAVTASLKVYVDKYNNCTLTLTDSDLREVITATSATMDREKEEYIFYGINKTKDLFHITVYLKSKMINIIADGVILIYQPIVHVSQ